MPQPLLIAIAFLTALFVQLMHMNALNRKFIANDQYFRRDKYWTAERFSIMATIVFIAMFSMGFPYVVADYKIRTLYQIVCYILAGGIGVGAFSYFLGRSDKYLKKEISNRLNIDENQNDKTP